MKKEPFVVFEFNAATVRVCRSVLRGSKRIVTHCFSFPIAVSWKDFSDEIRNHLKSQKLHVSKAVLMLPRDKAVSHLWVFPSNKADEISQMVRLRVLKECFGMDKENLVYDYKIVGTDKEGCAQVVVFLLQRPQIDKYTEVLLEAGIRIEGITLNTAGLFNWAKFLDNSEKKEGQRRVFLLNADDRTFDFQLLAEGKTVFSRSFHLAATDEGQDNLSKEIKLSLELCRRQQKTFSEGNMPADFCVIGSSDKLLGLDIGSWIGNEFTAFDPLDEARSCLDLKSPANGPSISYAAVLGLALLGSYDGVDLTPRQIKRDKELFEKKKSFKRWFLSFAGACIVLFMIFSVSIERKIIRLSGFKKELSLLRGPEKVLGGLLMEHYIEKEVLKDRFIIDVLKRLSEKTPAGISFVSLDLGDEGSVVFSGVAENAEILADFLATLKAERAFKNVRMDFSQLKEGQGGQGVKFRILSARR